MWSHFEVPTFAPPINFTCRMHAKKHKIDFWRRSVKYERTQGGVIWIAASDDTVCPLSSRNITVNLSVAGS